MLGYQIKFCKEIKAENTTKQTQQHLAAFSPSDEHMKKK